MLKTVAVSGASGKTGSASTGGASGETGSASTGGASGETGSAFTGAASSETGSIGATGFSSATGTTDATGAEQMPGATGAGDTEEKTKPKQVFAHDADTHDRSKYDKHNSRIEHIRRTSATKELIESNEAIQSFKKRKFILMLKMH